ncbi:hypothetical protein HON22_02075, partial [Candidatus Peregrinibacteria bacterium]|nr:hypothetical protein [Candidatus Peregrinibacteria bacterium]
MIFLDLETTGFDPKKDKIIEFAAVRVDKNFEVIETLDFLVNPECPIPPIVSKITQIFDKDVNDSAPFEARIEEVQAFVKEDVIIGHNIRFDLSFLQERSLCKKNSFIDTCNLAEIALPKQKSYALEILSDVFEIEHKYKHRALGDVLACVDLMKISLSYLRKFPETFWQKVREFEGKTESRLYGYFLDFNNNKSFENSSSQIISEAQIEDVQKTRFWISQNDEGRDFTCHENKVIQLNSIPELLSYTENFLEKEKGVVSVPTRLLHQFESYFGKMSNIIPALGKKVSKTRIKEFFNKESFNEEESLVLLKILRNESQEKGLSESELNIHWHDSSIWKEQLQESEEEYESSLLKYQGQNDVSYIANHETLLKGYLPVDKNTPLLFVDLREEDLDKVFGGAFPEHWILQRVYNEELKKLLADFFISCKEWFEFNMEEIGDYGTQKNIKSFQMDQLLSKHKEYIWSIAEKIYNTETHLQKHAGIFRKFFSDDECVVRYASLNKNMELCFYVYPQNYKDIINRSLSKKSSFIGLSMLENKEGGYIKSLFGIEDFENYLSKESEKKLIHLPTDTMPGPKKPEYMDILKKKLHEIFEKSSGRVAIICPNKKQIEELYLFFSDVYKGERKIIAGGLSGGRGKMIHSLKS